MRRCRRDARRPGPGRRTEALRRAMTARRGPAYRRRPEPGTDGPALAGPGSRPLPRLRMPSWRTGLDRYDGDRNDPTQDGTSGLSAVPALRADLPGRWPGRRWMRGGPGARSPSLEQLIGPAGAVPATCVRFRPRRLRHAGRAFPAWARAPRPKPHAATSGPTCTSAQDFEAARTHDPYWNAAQNAAGPHRDHAQLHAHVLGQEDPGVERDSPEGLRDGPAT
ncbi:MAG: hypothetical protein MZV70_05770 [Desulfobacterales bacterium]|nr:hypothetical protein [Desulfobacterales bacterium]